MKFEKKAFRHAVDNIAKWGDTDIFPYPMENRVLFDKGEEVSDILHQMSRGFDEALSAGVQHHSTLAPAGYTGFRWATQVDPLWNAYLLGVVLHVSKQIESVRIPEDRDTVFSYRLADTFSDGLFKTGSWRKFQDTTRARAELFPYVVTVDIADFYSRVYHHRIENALAEVESTKIAGRQVVKILGGISNGTSYGLPVGGPAARILSELLLNRVDRLLSVESSTAQFCRYADDYRFFVKDLPSAHRALGIVAEKLQRNEGLALQKAKTRILTSADYVAMLDPVDPPPGSASHFLNISLRYDPYSSTADEDYEELQGQLDRFDILALLQEQLRKQRIHSAVTKRLVSSLKHLDKDVSFSAILSLFQNMEILSPVAPQVFIAICDCMDQMDQDRRETVCAKVRDLVSLRHPVAQLEVNLGFMIRILSKVHSQENEEMLIRLYGANHGFGSGKSPSIQRDIMLVLAKWRTSYWLSDQKNYAGTMHPWVKRAFWIASFNLGDEGSHWRRANKSGLEPFDALIRDWMSDRTSQPGWELSL